MLLYLGLVTNHQSWKHHPGINKRYIRKVIYRTIKSIALEASGVELAIVLTDDEASALLNEKYRQKAKPTNVLSFPSSVMPGDDSQITYLGDIVLAYQTILSESAKKSRDPAAFLSHFTHLLVHGVLHLLGYSHDDDENALVMESLEVKILQSLGISNPYAE